MPHATQIASAALEALLGVEEGQYADRALNEVGRRFKLQADARFAVKRWLYRTLRWRARFDAVLDRAGEPWGEPYLRSAGRLALAAHFESPPQTSWVDGLADVLIERGRRRAAGLLAKLPPLAKQTELAAGSGDMNALAEAYSHPRWLVERFFAVYGDDALKLLEANNAEPPTTLRANTLKTTVGELSARLAAEGVETAPGRYSPLALTVTNEADVFRTEAFRDGLFELQDEASQLVGWVLDPKPRGVVIDACAGAGGKSLLLAGLLKNRARLLSLDIYENKLERLRERARRAGVSNLQAKVVAPGGVDEDLAGQADAVLVDAPCTGSGVLRRNPDAKWRLQEKDVAELAARQFGILTGWAQAVKPGGTLVYSTCSVLPEENGAVVEKFLATNSDFTLAPAVAKLPQSGERFATPEGYFAALPHRDGTDGFFAARMVRKK